jgi:hypothetical protein
MEKGSSRMPDFVFGEFLARQTYTPLKNGRLSKK